MERDPAPSKGTAPPNAVNEYLNREIQRLEGERDAMSRELEQIQHSYAWRMVAGYRRWIARHRDNSIFGFCEKIAIRILERAVGNGVEDERKRYQRWMRAHDLSSARIASLTAEAASFPYRPLISFVIAVGAGAIDSRLAATIDSVRAQCYGHWQLCVVSDGSTGSSVEAMLARYLADDARLSLHHHALTNGAQPSTMDLADAVQGEFVCLLDQWGQLRADALYEVVKQLNRNPLDDLFYWDEDRVDSEGQRFAPFFKPDWSPDLLLSMNYFGESFVVRTALAKRLEGLQPGFGPSQSYNLTLRATEQTHRIVHLPDVLLHRFEGSASPLQTQIASERDRHNLHAIDDALLRRGLAGKVDVLGQGLYAVRYEIRDQPLVSIVIPTRDKCHLLRQCIDSIDHGTDYSNYEIIILDNDSAEPATLNYFKEIAGDKIKIIPCPGRFNFSTICNRGAAESSGEYLLFLNNDTQVIRRDWMRALIEQAQRPEVGAVGAKLLFPDGRIQHAGAVLGIGGMVGHAFRFQAGAVTHYFGLSDAIRDCSAVTAACMMMRRSVFDEVGGFDEKFLVDFTDVDLCLRMRARGYRIVYTPLALLYHHESATRRRMHLHSDYEAFVQRWGDCLKKPDPFYSRHLTQNREDWSIAP